MFSLSAILKKYREHKHSQAPAAIPVSGTAGSFDQKENIYCVSGTVMSSVSVEDDGPGREWYAQSLPGMKEIYRHDLQELSVRDQEILSSVSASLLAIIRDHPSGALKSAFADYPADISYLSVHALNVAVFAADMGRSLGYSDDKMLELIKAALLHETGMLGCSALVSKRERLSAEEFKEIQGHPQRARVILEKSSKDLSENVIKAVLQEHERFDGSGYPSALKEGAILEYAQITGICDVYEALTHTRPHRCRGTPVDAVKILLESKRLFPVKLLKNFIERTGIFPVGSLVRLNTREVAIVTAINVRSPLRPMVSVLFDAQGGKIAEPRRLNLSDHSIVYIEDCLEESPC